MRIFKNRDFNKWASKVNLGDDALMKCVDEMERGLFDAKLGGFLYKKRVAHSNKGKRDGFRSILVYKKLDCAFFIYGFAKNVRSNISDKELRALKEYGDVLLGLSEGDLRHAIDHGTVIEIKGETNG